MNTLANTFEPLEETEASGEAGPQLPPIIDAYNLSNDSTPIPSELIEGILHKCSKMVLGGGAKSFKTWSLLDLAVSVSVGIPWLKWETRRGRVLFLNFEIQSTFIRQRLNMIANAKGIDIKPGALDFWNLRGYACSYDEILPNIARIIRQTHYDLIVLDPLYKLLGNCDENSARDIGQLLSGIENLATQTGAAVVFGSHFSKGGQAGKDSIDRISGSGVFARDPDSILTFTQHEEENAFTVDATLRNFPPTMAFVAKWEYPCFTVSDLDPAKLKKRVGQKSYTPEQILQCLEDGMTTGKWEAAAKEETGVSHGKFFDLLKELPPGTAKKNGKKWVKLFSSK